MFPRSAVLALVLVWASPGGGVDRLTPEQKRLNIESFEHVWTTVRDKHWDPKLGGLDWQAVHDELLPQLERAATMEQARAVMEDMLSRLKQTHFDIVPATVYQEMEGDKGPGRTGIEVRVVEGRALVVSTEPDSPAAKSGVTPGWEIDRVDGKPLAPGLRKIDRNFRHSTLHDLMLEQAVFTRLAGGEGSHVKVGFRDARGRSTTIDMERARPRGSEFSFGNLPPLYFWVESRKVRPDVGLSLIHIFTRAVDPWAGSYYVESLTHELMHKAWHHIQEVESLGGMAKAIETGIPKMRIEEAAARRQAYIDSGREIIVGVNRYQTGSEEHLDTREVDNGAVRDSQLRRLAQVRAARNSRAVEETLAALTASAATGEGNLLDLAVRAARARATLGEISAALEKVFGRYQAVNRTISGVYSSESQADPEFQKARKLADEFGKAEGRRPRILIAKMGQDGHDRGAKVIATAFADLGFDVDVGPLFQTPLEAARMAVENDVHVLGVSSLAGGHKTLVPEVIAELRKFGRDDILVYVGGVIPPQDYDFLFQAGVAGVFGPGTAVSYTHLVNAGESVQSGQVVVEFE